MQMIAAKELRQPVPADSLPLAEAAENPVERVDRDDTDSETGGERFP